MGTEEDKKLIIDTFQSKRRRQSSISMTSTRCSLIGDQGT